MQDAFVDWMRHASPYITAHRGRTFVIAISGETMHNDGFTEIIHDIALLHSLGIRLALVFGARPQIAACLCVANITTEFVAHLRVTTLAALKCILPVVGALQLDLQARLTFSLSNSPMAGADINAVSGNFIIAKPLGVLSGTDFQHTGTVRKVRVRAIQQQINHHAIVVLPPLGFSPTAEIFNLSAEEVAQTTAVALQADKLIFLTPHGVLDVHAQQVHELSVSQALQLFHENPQQHALLAASEACRHGVRRTHIIDSGVKGALLKELFTRDGIGALISEELFEHIRPAQIDDVTGILALIEPLEAKGVLIRRSREQLEIEIDYFVVIERDSCIIGCAALYPYPEDQMAEIACLAIDHSYHKAKRGEQLLHYLEKHALQLQISRLLVLTTQSVHWFLERGFEARGLDEVPIQRATLYNYQRNSKILIKTLSV